MLFYRAALPLSSRTLNFVAGLIRRHRRSIGSVWRKLPPGRQALLVLAYLKKGETFSDLAEGFEAGLATAWRYVNEATELLAARAPKLRQAVRDAKRAPQVMEDPRQSPLLPLARRETRQGHPRTPAPRGLNGLKKAHWPIAWRT
jgi:hypothetical protein